MDKIKKRLLFMKFHEKIEKIKCCALFWEEIIYVDCISD